MATRTKAVPEIADPTRDELLARIQKRRAKGKSTIVKDAADTARAETVALTEGLSLKQAEELVGVPHATLCRWRNQVDPEKVEEAKTRLWGEAEKLATTAMRRAQNTIAKATPYQATLITCMMIDKMLLLAGQATARTVHEISDEEKLERLTSIAQRAADRKAKKLAAEVIISDTPTEEKIHEGH